MKNKTFWQSLVCALSGIKVAFKEEASMHRHLVLGTLAIIMGIICKLQVKEWLWIFTAIFLVIAFEMVNTAIENVVDLVTNYTYHPLAKKVKDIMAGAVLWITFFAVIIGILVYIPALLRLI